MAAAIAASGLIELADALPIARPGVSRHLRVLREAGLVSVEGLRFVQLPPVRARDADFRILFDGQDRPVDGPYLAARADALHAWHRALATAGYIGLSLPSRFGATVRYYITAAALLPVGATLGTILARGLADPLHGQVRLAHASVNVLGWMGLTVLGTLVTLWPTMLRTRIAPGAAWIESGYEASAPLSPTFIQTRPLAPICLARSVRTSSLLRP